MASPATALADYGAAAPDTPITTVNLGNQIGAVVWGNWNAQYLLTTASSSNLIYTVSDVWREWIQGQGTDTAGQTSGVVTTSSYFNNAQVWVNWNGFYVHVEETEAQRQERIELEARLRAAYAVEQAERARKEAAINAIARELLLGHLTTPQREQLETTKVFEVVGGSHKRRYRITEHAGVTRLDEKGNEVESYCIHPNLSDRLPPADLVLAKKLMLEHDEETFLKTANATRLRAS